MDVKTAINPIDANGLLKMKLNNGVIMKIARASKIKTLIMRNLWFIFILNKCLIILMKQIISYTT